MEFIEYRAEHSELESFPPYNFDAPDQSFEEQTEKGVLPPHRIVRFAWLDLGFLWKSLTHVSPFAGMSGENEKDRYKNLLDLEKAERAQKQKKKRAALSTSRSTIQPTPPKPQDQPPHQPQ